MLLLITAKLALSHSISKDKYFFFIMKKKSFAMNKMQELFTRKEIKDAFKSIF